METETKVLIALISAGSAILGAVVSQLVTIIRDVLDKRHKRKVLLREKYEELACLITDSQDWVTEQMNAASLSILRGSHPSKARKAMVLSHIYFPKLHSVCQDYVNACALFQTALVDNHEFHPDYDAGTQAAHKNPKALENAAGKLRDSRQHLEEAIIKYASKYAKA